ncbi:hypothetical protein D3C76_1277560 [compost metagenome]
MLITGMVTHRKRRLLPVTEQRCLIIRPQLFHHPIPKRQRPRLDHIRPGMPVQLAQVMGNAARTNQQHTLATQPRQRLAHPDLQRRPHVAGQ